MAALVVIGPGDPDDPGWVEARSVAEIAGLARAGHTVVVTPAALVGDAAEDAAELAVAAVCVWAGARVLRTTRPGPVRQAAEMADALAGRRPPALTRRGLA
ncbi:hypothetical protein [Streptosporangium pseudovulgare]|uniref:Uncharacterized protein n=1 Tax=Streptosporangium pseudovulgare TaxID=35765 RepID=A0ABQ2RE52_9ACTN|nr:hypothetical protein [Streptosporangium pseudovulgare]GGQ21332.1 hypothetical protein GCM10010140_59550 [Streptosporangium pseudovulgare]